MRSNGIYVLEACLSRRENVKKVTTKGSSQLKSLLSHSGMTYRFKQLQHLGELKILLSNLEPKEQRLLFKGKERENHEYLHMVGVRDEDKILLLEDPAIKERKLLSLAGERQTSILRMASQDKGRPLPKFGEWDVNNPASADGFTVIFAKARDEKKATGTAATAAPPSQTVSQPNASYEYCEKKKWLCCF
ncbi:unnamed protein product [Fraxinus pennsylvanica]|uniref:RIN4 pathogenic type III effector avirulence factor Avr cleavage site domain-containing protein n=1 Tax=Fraxinus pennsylvanica TaxID=56036 RepID=A0AAD1ZD87_9LAMI|nr:unnamed protein product [Fraxinus pennsylvanica]